MSSWYEATASFVADRPIAACGFVFAVTLAKALAVIGLLVPGTPILVLVGAMVAAGNLPMAPLILAATLGAIVGDGSHTRSVGAFAARSARRGRSRAGQASLREARPSSSDTAARASPSGGSSRPYAPWSPSRRDLGHDVRPLLRRQRPVRHRVGASAHPARRSAGPFPTALGVGDQATAFTIVAAVVARRCSSSCRCRRVCRSAGSVGCCRGLSPALVFSVRGRSSNAVTNARSAVSRRRQLLGDGGDRRRRRHGSRVHRHLQHGLRPRCPGSARSLQGRAVDRA